VKGLLFVIGTISLCVGVIGIVVPLLPTTPFLLLTSLCYAKSSKRFHTWLLNNKTFGTYIRNYHEGKGLPMKIKISVISLLWITITISSIIAVQNMILRILLFIIALAVTYHIIHLPTLSTDERENPI